MYIYEEQKAKIFNTDGVKMLLSVTSVVKGLFEHSSAVCALDILDKSMAGDIRLKFACMDYLVEIGYLHEITREDIEGQLRTFIKGKEIEIR